ncbi:Eukaryotic translation initiation factor 4B [Burkholderia gladioli]|nr:Eukaryotic translation initiation factor 4B [Burkholderia gladioli]
MLCARAGRARQLRADRPRKTEPGRGGRRRDRALSRRFRADAARERRNCIAFGSGDFKREDGRRERGTEMAARRAGCLPTRVGKAKARNR